MSIPSTELVIIDHRTGEEVDPADTPRVAAILDDARILRNRLSRVVDATQAVLLEQMDSEARWTLHAGTYKISGDSPDAADIEWDLDELHKLEGLIPSDRYAECVRQVVTEKPVTAELRRVAKIGGEVAQIISRAEHRKPKRRSVKVSRA